MRKYFPFLAIGIVAFLSGTTCGEKRNDDAIVVIIEDATIDDTNTEHPRDTITPRRDTTVTPRDTDVHVTPPVERRKTTLTGAVALLKLDLERKDSGRLLKHTASLITSVEKELSKSLSSERKRALNLFSLKLSSLKREVTLLNPDKDIPSTKVPMLESKIEELESIARRIENK